MNPDQSLADAQDALTKATKALEDEEHAFAAVKARYRMKICAGESVSKKLREKDIDAMIEIAIDDDPEVREAYLSYRRVHNAYLDAKGKHYNLDKLWWETRNRYGG